MLKMKPHTKTCYLSRFIVSVVFDIVAGATFIQKLYFLLSFLPRLFLKNKIDNSYGKGGLYHTIKRLT